MNGIVALARLEARRSFRTPVAFAVMGLFLLVHGTYFVSLMENYTSSSMTAIASGQTPDRLNLIDLVLQPLASADTFLLLLLLPGISMRLLSEEWRSRTSELLLSLPLSEAEVVWGKFLGAALLLTALLLLGLLAPLSAAFFGTVEWWTVLAQWLGLFFFGLAGLAVGLFYSSITGSQILAYGLTVVTLFGSWLLGWWGRALDGTAGAVVSWMSMATHFNPSSLGILRLSDLVFFVGVILGGLHLAAGVLQSRRWRKAR